MRTGLCAAALLASANGAFASGALWCSVDDHQVAFQLDAGVTRGLGGPTFNFRGDLEIKARKAGDSLRKTVFEDQNLAQYWLDGEELRLLVYREHEAADSYRSVELTILTKARDESTYDGRYTLSVYDGSGAGSEPVEFKGDVSCGAE
ncbi:hypothetical protein EN836_24715 [Mesorhizobium sp. M1C.F.Ca.ET.193.01.1.1]|uniref:hypothetical protein n=1 Tax=unclassified Mesorhizobium TaxID=325217 RepID=UPI000FD411F2|nr:MULTISPECIES: hypothetical protein [unclassified Mesorhizobium]TGS95053.1 hypothetical protein EN820_44960 [bacterium M00.F.Ca.ET.177.01.1.1]TGQ51392.1 hypothetical protein EN853_24705 [Mesorhizobium sp. M1C.F.Ca.ET.210.01.1.1]TGQ67182.1 hypothetical protein EN855_024715 [Mesorhizobium sp. M1C.F.Ca.ET.212.01.1.1]TGR01837.1 hypothetical protein EN847_24705 [Mesorhizobium sp. M1C.F.Ca.ET.204.01.1.1]TGR22519.1 hypothetical protein EN839_24705 [Mesorhizobium sp. M1C.F.Ca.ET.196.01.1.1]